LYKQLRIGIIGTGFIGKQHIEAIRRIPNLKVAAIVDRNEDTAKFISEQLGIEKWYTEYRDLLDDDTVDVIHNCTPSFMHFTINKEAILKGKHVYCEKPLTLNTEESAQLVELAKEYDVAVGVNFNYRHNAMVQQMHQIVKNGKAGRILMVTGQYLQDWLLYNTDYDWRMNSDMAGKSRAIADIGSHCFDIAQFVIGKKISSVYANLFVSHSVRKHCNALGKTENISIHSEDGAFILGKFEDGTPFSFTFSQVSAGKKNALSLTISGSENLLEWHQEKPDILNIGHRDRPNELIFTAPEFLEDKIKSYGNLPAGHSVGWHDALTNAMKAYYGAIFKRSYKAENQNYATFETGYQIMKLVDACLESSDKNQWVKL
jgi:predicted dehydrogenase